MGKRCEGIGMVSELERAAMKGDTMPDGLSQAEQIYFQGLAYLYARFKAGSISRDVGSKEKMKMLCKKEKAEENYQFWKKYNDYQVMLRKDTEAAISAYRKNRTLENADKLVDILDGIKKGAR